MQVGKGEATNMFLLDLEKLDEEESNDSTEIVLDCRQQKGLDIPPVTTSGHKLMIQRTYSGYVQ
jgi:hypothetical protein